MKQKLPILAGLILATSIAHNVNAQSIDDSRLNSFLETDVYGMTLLKALPSYKAKTNTSKTTAGKEPLTSKAVFEYRDGEFAPVDSTRFTYSGTRTTNNEDNLDSMDFDMMNKYVFSKSYLRYDLRLKGTKIYDASNHLMSHASEKLDAGTGLFKSDEKKILTYDASFNVATILIQAGIPGTTSWTDSRKYSYTYNSSNLMLTETVMIAGAGSLENYERTSYTYDASGNMLTYEIENWNSTTSAWVGYYKNMFTYTPTNKRATAITQLWDGSSYKNTGKYTYTYDASDRYANYLYQTWNATGSVWANTYKYYKYNWSATGKCLSYTISGWNSGAGTYDDFNRFAFTYDATNNMLTYTKEEYEFTIPGVWDKTVDDIYTYNSTNDQLTNFSHKTFMDYTTYTTYETFKRYTYSYNSSHQKTSSLTDNGYGMYYLDTLVRYHYNEAPAAIAEQGNQIADLQIYPVPANTFCNIALRLEVPQDFTITLTDISGHVFMSMEQNGVKEYKETLDVQNLPAGNYFIQIKGQSGVSKTQAISIFH